MHVTIPGSWRRDPNSPDRTSSAVIRIRLPCVPRCAGARSRTVSNRNSGPNHLHSDASCQVFASFVVEEGSIRREANLQSLSATVAWVLPLIQLTALIPNPHPTHHTHHTIHTTPHTHTHRVREPAKSCSIPHRWAATGTLECPAPIVTRRRRRRRCRPTLRQRLSFR